MHPAAVHTPASVFSLRHAPSWMLLCLSAGCVNAIAFLACARFITHVTGTVSHISISAATTVDIALEYGFVLACFIFGAMTSSALIEARHHNNKRTLNAAPLVLVGAILAAVGLIGSLGWFGEFGGSVEGTRDFAFLSILAFAMGLQNAAVATSTGMLVRTTHMTGPATDLGVHLTVALHTQGEARKTAIRHAALRAGKMISFAAGAGLGGVLAARWGYASLFVPSIVVITATVLSFARRPALSTIEAVDPSNQAA